MSADIHHLEAGVPGFQVDGLTESIPANALFADGAACAIVHGSHALAARSAYRRGFALGLAGLCPGVWPGLMIEMGWLRALRCFDRRQQRTSRDCGCVNGGQIEPHEITT